MLEKINQIVQKHNIFSHQNAGIFVASVKDQQQGFQFAKEVLYELSDSKTIVYLSGGRTPKDLYSEFAREEQLLAGAVGQIDERYGVPLHDTSNQKMMQEAGLLRYLQMRDIRFYPILQGKSREEAAGEYDKTVRELNTIYQQSIGILGVGMDGHTAGIAGNRKDFQNPMFDESQRHVCVSHFNDEKGMYKERISMTFLGLSMLDVLIVLVFGDDKKEAVTMMFADGKEEDIPSRFYKRPEIAAKTLLVTDQVA